MKIKITAWDKTMPGFSTGDIVDVDTSYSHLGENQIEAMVVDKQIAILDIEKDSESQLETRTVCIPYNDGKSSYWLFEGEQAQIDDSFIEVKDES